MTRLALIAVLGLALAGSGAAAPKVPEKPADKPVAPPQAADAPAKPAPPPPVARHCTLPDGGTRVLTLKQKKCRVANACACADPCPPCP